MKAVMAGSAFVSKQVNSNDAKPIVDAAIALPLYLADETRQFDVVSWSPVVENKQVVRVQVEVMVRLKKDTPCD